MGFGRLSAVQRDRVEEWLPGAEVVADLSWNQVETVVLRVRHGRRELIVKASGDADHHLGRELDAHEGGFVAPWQHGGHAARLRHGSAAARAMLESAVILEIDTLFEPEDLPDRLIAQTLRAFEARRAG